MRVYVVQLTQLGSDVLPHWYPTATAAMQACQAREGCTGSDWERHDSHGLCWSWRGYVISELVEAA